MQRMYVGRHQRASGAWTSVIRSKSNLVFGIGLYQPVSKLLKCSNLEKGYYYGTYVDCECVGQCMGEKTEANGGVESREA